MWLGMLLGMLISWIVDGSPHYPSMGANQRIAYISDIGAQHLKPLFIAGSVITTIFLDLSFVSERWLRHRGVLTRNETRSEKVLSVFGILFAIVGTAGLILLSIFDTLRHPHLHDGFLLLFIAGYIISAIFTCAEYQRLGVHVRQYSILRASFWIKLIFIIVELVFAICFATLTFTGHQQQAAVFEWVIALIFTFWVLSFFVDLLPAVRSRKYGGGKGVPQIEMGGPNGTHYEDDGASNRYTNGNGLSNGQTNVHAYAERGPASNF
ncbi:MAG: hypothetical protein MMC23_003618 [Stictis urceolatum]|nr:hypothetical protein [Stictis urceolata]